MKYRIRPGNALRYAGSFHDDECIECLADIEEGDPVGFLLEKKHRNLGLLTQIGMPTDKMRNDMPGRYGPLCYDCLEDIATPMEVEITKR